MKKQISNLSNKLQIVNCGSINNNINNSNNITNLQQINNNIVINTYANTDISHLTDGNYVNCISKVNKSLDALIQLVHFNPLKPENMNMYLSNLKEEHLMIKRDEWVLENARDSIGMIVVHTLNIFKNWIRDPNTTVDEQTLKYYHKFLDNLENDEIVDRVKDKLLITLFNGKTIVKKHFKNIKNN